MTDRKKAIGMYSGGLDSILSTKVMIEEGFEVIALHFYTGFNGEVRRDVQQGASWKWTPAESVLKGAERLGIDIVALDVTDEFTGVLLKPRYGYGSGANPCIDCRIFNLAKAREIMEAEGASFVFTGEVLGQRPMSQHKNALELVAKRSGLEGRLLRPLSAQHLSPTIPETEGIVNRDHLHDFHGRSRKPQMALAEKFGIDWYPNAGPGCILTDKAFTGKFDDLVEHRESRKINLDDLLSLKTGRHLRLDTGVKVIVGRIEEENDYLEDLLGGECWLFTAKDYPGALVVAFDNPGEDDMLRIAAICARYGKGVSQEAVTVIASKGTVTRELTVKPVGHPDIEAFIIK